MGIVREGAVSAEDVAAALEGQFHFDPATYDAMIHADIPAYDRFQEELARRSGAGGPARAGTWGPGTGRRQHGCWRATLMRSLSGSRRERRMLRAAREPLPSGA